MAKEGPSGYIARKVNRGWGSPPFLSLFLHSSLPLSL